MLSIAISLSAGVASLIINESTGFSLGIIFTAFCGLWWLGRKLQNLEDRMETAQQWREEVKHALKKADEERAEVMATLRNLPCNPLNCPKR